MTRTSRLLTALAALMLLGMYFLPLWRVALEAPQYPEGIGMYIEISDIRGFTEFDLDKINNLNHYIGMQRIDPASIPELKFMPWILGALVLMGLAVAAIGRRRLLHVWLAALVLAGIAGLADFYRWGHDYGHNLDERAIIKVPGMAYQPPVIGRKQLLNFTAASWPASGGLLAGAAFLVGLGALYVDRRRGSGSRRRIAAGAALAVAACAATGPRDIAYDGSETCAYCSMAITDHRFGTQLLTSTGRTHVFDSIECLASYVSQPDVQGRIRGLWVTDYSRPGTLLSVENARFIRVSGPGGSPMGLGLRAFAANSPEASDESMDWSAVLALVNELARVPVARSSLGEGV
jgi:copper chaperone NosL